MFNGQFIELNFCLCIAATATIENKMCKPLKKLLKKLVAGEAHEQLAVADAKLGNVIKVCYVISSFGKQTKNESPSKSSLITLNGTLICTWEHRDIQMYMMH